MRFTNVTGLPAGWTMGFQRDGRESLIVIVKATFVLPEEGETAVLASDQVALVEADRFSGEPGMSAPLHETDYAHVKPGCDVLLVGNAHAPGGRPATRCPVRLRVGPVDKRFTVVGNRWWSRGPAGISHSSPEPFVNMPVTYDRAFGGTDRTRESDGLTETCPTNPVGQGYWRHAGQIDGQPLPNSEGSTEAIQSHDVLYAPWALSPIGRNWQPRLGYTGTYDRQWQENVAPLWPADFDERYFQSAPPDQVMPWPRGGEDVLLENLSPAGTIAFRLPALAMPVTFIPYKGRDVTAQSNIDTLVFEPDLGRFTMAWRCVQPLGRSLFDVRETIAGEMSAAWHRARRFPGKTYYPDLAAAVRDRPRRRGAR